MIQLLWIFVAFAGMELVAWSNHKYIMHGFLWKWHKDHHRKDNRQPLPQQTEERKPEKNDLFFLIYALPAIVLLIIGLSKENATLISLGTGISLYGLLYFGIHDLVIHQRLPLRIGWLQRSAYLNALIRAHKAHHQPKNKKDFSNYGLLLFPRSYFNH